MTQSLFSRLYTRGGGRGRSQLEDYLTEVLGTVFDRLDGRAKRSFLRAMMDRSASALFDKAFDNLDSAVLATQVKLDKTGQGKRPDMVVRLGGRDILVIEAKLGAAMMQHHDPDAPEGEGDEAVTRSQLATYAKWIAGRNEGQSDGWPGAVILLTAWTPPPIGFPSKLATCVRESVRTWTGVAAWIVMYSATLDAVPRALSGELLAFLKEKNLLDRHIDARDVAALTFYAASEEAFRHTTRSVLKAIVEAHPNLGSYRSTSVGVDQSIGAYVGWIFLNQHFQSGGSRFWLGLGICAKPGAAFDEDSVRSIGGEPFVMVYFGDDNVRQKPIDHVSSLPDGWIEVTSRPALVATKPIREFAGDPESRGKEIQSWACEQVGALVPVMKSYA